MLDPSNFQNLVVSSALQRNIYTPMFLAALFTITKIWKQPKVLSLDEDSTHTHTHTRIYVGILFSSVVRWRQYTHTHTHTHTYICWNIIQPLKKEIQKKRKILLFVTTIFIGRTEAEAETSILWPSDTKNWLIGIDPDAGKDWRPEKGTTEDEMVGWHQRLNGHEFE